MRATRDELLTTGRDVALDAADAAGEASLVVDLLDDALRYEIARGGSSSPPRAATEARLVVANTGVAIPPDATRPADRR
ncbi:MAG TPA: hypothetical protein VMD59_04995 [Acidimicrobiales bacterium]|nr:hypothetical protein [Acidimicrobiales bacterium]